MATTRRQFIKRSAGAVTVSLFLPELILGSPLLQDSTDDRRLVITGLLGGNDVLNTVVPYTDPKYYEARPELALREADLKGPQGQSMTITEQFALHPALVELKALYDERRLAIINGVGSSKANLSHFDMMAQWHTGDPSRKKSNGWLGRYLNLKFGSTTAIPAMSLRTFFAPQTLRSSVGVPNVVNFADYGLQGDPQYPNEQADVLKAFNTIYQGLSGSSGFLGEASRIGLDAVQGALRIRSVTANYRSSVTYPASSISDALKMVAQVLTTMPEVKLFYVEMFGFDTHARQIEGRNARLEGSHATLLSQYSKAVKAFYDDLKEHGLQDRVTTLAWSEFSRQVKQNASLGTDHGMAGSVFVIGPVQGGVYGEYPSLTDLDSGINLKVKVDFRSVYATILQKWLAFDSKLVFDEQFEDLGFMP